MGEADGAVKGAPSADVARIVGSITHEVNNSLGKVAGLIELGRRAQGLLQAQACLAEAATMIERCRAQLTLALREIPGYASAKHSSDIYTSEAPSVIPASRKPAALVVEDETYVREFVVRLLSGRFEVTQAESGEQGLRCAGAEGAFDLIVTDTTMPGRSGVDLVRGLRELQPHARLVVMSGQLYRPEELEAFRGAGMEAFLAKPFPVYEFHDIVDSLVR